MVYPDGSYPILGRSITYRCGAFHGLATAALRHSLPPNLEPAKAQVALTHVIRRTLEAPETFNEQGFLNLGLAGHQTGLAENYINTGSVYLASLAFVPLGLPPSDPFWSDPPVESTWEQGWSGKSLQNDHALRSKCKYGVC
eukprot:scaffold5050_cov137-Amphora_coffeaeformis.AAC.1